VADHVSPSAALAFVTKMIEKHKTTSSRQSKWKTCERQSVLKRN